jgi:hypothetical protein
LLAEPDILLNRFRARIQSGSRHPGHADAEAFKDLKADLAIPGRYAPLTIPGTTLRLDTAHSEAVDLRELAAALVGTASVPY